jgi:hypothetical protein
MDLGPVAGDRPHAAMVASRPGEADKMPTAVRSFKASIRMSLWLGLPARPTLMGWLG